jgi:hypothetical protein
MDESVEKLDKLLRHHLGRNNNTASITFTGSGFVSFAVALIAIICMVWAAGEFRIARAERAADMRELQSLRDEVHKIGDKVDTHQIWLQDIDAKVRGKEKPK